VIVVDDVGCEELLLLLLLIVLVEKILLLVVVVVVIDDDEENGLLALNTLDFTFLLVIICTFSLPLFVNCPPKVTPPPPLFSKFERVNRSAIEKSNCECACVFNNYSDF